MTKRAAAIASAVIAALIVAYTAGGIIVGPAMYSNAGWGFLVADSMAAGAPFNHLVEPDPDDIARDASSFVARWSPGQYIFAYGLERLGLSLGAAITVVSGAFTLLGLVGWYRLYRRWAFPPAICMAAVAITTCTRAVALPFGIYNGGEVLLFGGLPWFVLLLLRWQALSIPQALGIAAAFAVVAFLKLSGLVFAYAALAAIVVGDLWPPSAIKWRRPLLALAIAAAFGAAFYFLWYSQGWTAADATGPGHWLALGKRFIEGCGATLLAMLSLGDMAARLLQHPGYRLLESLDAVFLLTGLAAIALAVPVYRRLREAHGDYARFAAATAVLYILVMSVVYARGGALQMEDGFFRPLSLVLLIGVVHVTAEAPRSLRLPLGVLVAAALAYGLASYVAHLRQDLDRPLASRGFRHGTLTAPGVELVKKELAGPFDRKDTIVLVPSPEIALDLPTVRTIARTSDFESADQLKATTWHGRVGHIFVLLQTKMIAEGKAAIILGQFADYDPAAWSRVTIGDFTLFSQASR